MDVTKRFDRLLGIYFYLQSKPIVKAQELATKFDVSLRTIYRDVKSLEIAGVPLIGEAGHGYALMSTYKMAPILFTQDEALSFSVAEKLMQHYLDKQIGEHFANALLKMKAVLRYSDKENVASLENKVLINKKQNFLNKNVPAALSILFESIVKKRQVLLSYQSVESKITVQRNIEPIGVFQEAQYWYFMAHCHFRKEVRQFRLDRISSIQLSDIAFSESHLTLDECLQNRRQHIEKQIVRILVSKEIARYITWDRQYYGFIEEKEVKDGVEMIFHSKNMLNEFARWFLMFADEATILEPLELQIRVKELLTNAMTKLM